LDGRRLAYAACAVVAAAAWWQSQTFGLGPALLPRLASASMGALALIGLFAPAPAAPAGAMPVWRPLAAIAALAAYGALMPRIGFLVTTEITVAGLVLGFGGFAGWRWSLVSAAFVALVYVAFSTIFYVTFPAGIAR
jgi:hypothetical protein